MKAPFYRDCTCRKIMGGKRPLWHAKHSSHPDLTGAGNNGDNAIKDLQKQVAWRKANPSSVASPTQDREAFYRGVTRSGLSSKQVSQ